LNLDGYLCVQLDFYRGRMLQGVVDQAVVHSLIDALPVGFA
jgi:hypothetical protein